MLGEQRLQMAIIASLPQARLSGHARCAMADVGRRGAAYCTSSASSAPKMPVGCRDLQTPHQAPDQATRASARSATMPPVFQLTKQPTGCTLFRSC